MYKCAKFVSFSVMPPTPRVSSSGSELHIRLFHSDYMRLRAGEWRTQNVRDAFWRFYVNDRDGAALLLKNEAFPLRAGRLYFVPEDVFFSCHNDCAVEHYYAHFDVIGLPMAIRQALFSTPIEVEDTALQQEAVAIAGLVKSTLALDVALRCRIKALLLRALATVLEKDGSATLDADSYHEHLEPAIEYIENHLSKRIDNAQLARCCHWSTDHFGRRFHESIGKTPGQYVQARRIAVASQLLLFTDKSIEQIAEETGFSNRFHFSRAFARVMNCGPAAYRRRRPV
jgi:AraC-like DNA-binding protein